MSWLRRPSRFAVALTVVGTLIFVGLGFWQLHRADEKDELLRRYAASATAPQEPLSSVEDGAPADRYPRLGAEGEFVPDRYYILDDQTHGGQVGIRVFVPFLPRNTDKVLLVDLGFLPKEGGKNPSLPPLPPGRQAIHGLYVPSPGVGMRMGGDALPGQTGPRKSVVYIDLGEIGADFGHTLYPRVLLLDADPASIYTREWTPDVMPPARHRAYAFQWFTFAVAAVVIFVLLHRKRRPKRPSTT
ncbi:cytochrome oxidase assembly protein ShyY1 [Luteibacter rhizovicinus]|uniref:SURF1-like protein n=1 Tax=Luteibacter rhizovicinus TaxID=242606 RepID=A0A4R3YUM6_9GAMM|nr:SURF1 family protein [Luteibacter rhizovicinus]TCV96106.1 cytochrome oxidase assembly protein ShyY1 [Luteibacter rhizovicinus]